MEERLNRILDSNILFLLVLILSIGYLYGSIRIGYNIYDEGIVVYGADRILKGDIPYRDFWTMYAPGQFYAVALIFRLFGTNLFVTRIYSATINFLIVLLVYLIIKKISGHRLAILAFILSTLWMGGWGLFHSSPTPAGTFWSLLSILFVVDFLCDKNYSSLFIGGLITGITAIFRHDIGGYTFISSTIVLILYIYLRISNKNIIETVKLWSRYLWGTIVGFVPFAIYLLSRVPLRDVIFDLIVFPAKVFPRVRDLPYPLFDFSFYSFLFYFPIIIYIIGGILIILSLFKWKDLNGREWSIILFWIIGVFFFNQARVRSDVPHLLPTIIPAMMLLVSLYNSKVSSIWKMGYFIKVLTLFISFLLILSLYRNALRGFTVTVYILPIVLGTVLCLTIYILIKLKHLFRKTTLRISSQILSLILCIFILFSFIKGELRDLPTWVFISFSKPGLVPSQIDRAKGIYVFENQEYFLSTAIKFVQANTKPDELIFVGNSRHDRIFVNDVMFYFLSERHSATKYHELHPGLATTEEVQREIIDELKRNSVKFIVLWSGAEDVTEPNESSISSRVTTLDDFIKMNYAPIMYFGPYKILQKLTVGDIG
ncbi:MAG: glycosyltransferase family 39 protein [bacterium]|nr:glycosyltransferase family 39 protein [bacterium]